MPMRTAVAPRAIGTGAGGGTATGTGVGTGPPGDSTSVGSPTLPNTGTSWDLAVAGALLVFSGMALLRLSQRRTRHADA